MQSRDGTAIGNPTLPGVGNSAGREIVLPTDLRDCKRLPFPPDLKITKILKSCCTSSASGDYSELCEFSMSLKNNGSATYSGPIRIFDADPNSDPSDPGLGSLGQTFTITIGPQETKTYDLFPRHYKPGTRFKNCVSLTGQRPDTSTPPNPGVSCVTQDVPVAVGQCLAATPPRPPPPPPPTTSCQAPNFLVNGMCCDARSYQAGLCGGTTISDCPAGTRRGSNGQCFFVDPGCQGPNCGQVTTGCPGNVARNSDGNCPTTTSDCPAGMRRGSNGQCFFVDPGCQGPNCGQVTTGCPLGAPRNPDGSCCNARSIQDGTCGGKPPPQTSGCAGGLARNPDGSCPTTTTKTCPTGQSLVNNVCCGSVAECSEALRRCPDGKPRKNGECPTLCPDGSEKKPHALCPPKDGSKKTKDKLCPQGTHLVNNECVRKLSNQQRNTSSGNQNKSSGNQKLKAGPNVNTAPLVNAIGQGNKSSGGRSKNRGN